MIDEMKERLCSHGASLQKFNLLSNQLGRYKLYQGYNGSKRCEELEQKIQDLYDYNVETSLLLESVRDPLALKVVSYRFIDRFSVAQTADFLAISQWQVKKLSKEALKEMVAHLEADSSPNAQTSDESKI